MKYEELIDKLRKSYSIRDYVKFYKTKYPNYIRHFTNGITPQIDRLLFTDVEENNNKIVKDIIDKAELLREKFQKVLGEDSNKKIYYKVLDAYISQIKELEGGDGECTAKEFKNILEQTLFKCFAYEDLMDVIDNYLMQCKLLKHYYKIGDVLKDDDFIYIANPLKKMVDNENDINRIFSKKHDSYELFYYDPDEEEECSVIISGEYEVGVRRVR